MLIAKGSVATQPVDGSAPRAEVPLGTKGGLTRLGANITVLQPGERSAKRHWHEEEDELLYMIEGEAVLVENDGEHPLRPGDVACWPAGVANAHHVLNRSDAPVRFLVVGSNPAVDHVHYPDDGLILHHAPPRWQLVTTEGTVVRQGETG